MWSRIVEKIRKKLESPESYARRIGVRIGPRCRIKSRSFGSEPYLIEIGEHVNVSSGVHFANHDGGVWVGRDETPDLDVMGRIRVGDNTIIGNRAMIFPGVEIGRNCVIGAHSVVTKSIPDGSVVAGNPARYLCTTEDYLARMRPLNVRTKGLDSAATREKVLVDGTPMMTKPLIKMDR